MLGEVEGLVGVMLGVFNRLEEGPLDGDEFGVMLGDVVGNGVGGT
jgi:hypothetical protein